MGIIANRSQDDRGYARQLCAIRGEVPSAALVLATLVGFGLCGLGLAACGISRPIEEQHPSVQRAPGSVDDSEESKRDALNRTAVVDLGCPKVEIVLTLERRYANTASARYVVEGCGVRALYAETCEAYPSCRYLQLSSVPLARAAQTIVLAPGSQATPGGAAASGSTRVPVVAPPVPSASTAAPSASAPPRYL